MEFETQSLTKSIRNTLEGTFVKTTDGYIHYQLKGEGECIVLVHGMTTPFFVWNPTFDFLVEHGFKVLRYDLFGRGYSDRVNQRYDVDLFDRQLNELLNSLELSSQKVSLIGLSLGGGICANFVNRHKELIKKVCLIDPVHPAGLPQTMKLLRIPILNRLIKRFVGKKILFGSLENNFANYRNFPHFKEEFTKQLKFKGYSNAIISTMVHYDYRSLNQVYNNIGKLNIPICLFWGEDDIVVPYKINEKFRTAIPDIIFHPIKEAGHLSHHEKPEIVNPLLLSFLKQ